MVLVIGGDVSQGNWNLHKTTEIWGGPLTKDKLTYFTQLWPNVKLCDLENIWRIIRPNSVGWRSLHALDVDEFYTFMDVCEWSFGSIRNQQCGCWHIFAMHYTYGVEREIDTSFADLLLNKEDAHHLARMMFPGNMTKKYINDSFQSFDVDGDGFLTKDEWCRMLSGSLSESQSEPRVGTVEWNELHGVTPISL